jgi:hypothetical protein
MPGRAVGDAINPQAARHALVRLSYAGACTPMQAPTETRNGDSQRDTKLGKQRDAGLAVSPDRRQYWPCRDLLGITRPKVGRGIRRRGLTSGSG